MCRRVTTIGFLDTWFHHRASCQAHAKNGRAALPKSRSVWLETCSRESEDGGRAAALRRRQIYDRRVTLASSMQRRRGTRQQWTKTAIPVSRGRCLFCVCSSTQNVQFHEDLCSCKIKFGQFECRVISSSNKHLRLGRGKSRYCSSLKILKKMLCKEACTGTLGKCKRKRQKLGVGLEPLSPIASAANGIHHNSIN